MKRPWIVVVVAAVAFAVVAVVGVVGVFLLDQASEADCNTDLERAVLVETGDVVIGAVDQSTAQALGDDEDASEAAGRIVDARDDLQAARDNLDNADRLCPGLF